MSELMGQMRHGTPLSERDCFALALQHASGLREAVRGLALLRADDKNHAFGWLSMVGILDQLIDNIKLLMVRGVNRTNLILPSRFRDM